MVILYIIIVVVVKVSTEKGHLSVISVLITFGQAIKIGPFYDSHQNGHTSVITN